MWEYQVLLYSGHKDLTELLNVEGSSGWELAWVFPDPEAIDCGSVILKRQTPSLFDMEAWGVFEEALKEEVELE